VSDPADGLAFWIRVTPRARRPRVGGEHAGELRVAVAAPPADGAANAACVAALALAFGVRRGDVVLEAGLSSRRKRVRITGDPAALERRLRALAAGG
jgi:hypothetical protein